MATEKFREYESPKSTETTHEQNLSLFRFAEALLCPESPDLRKEYEEFLDNQKKEGKLVFLSIAEEKAKKRGKMRQKLAIVSRMLDGDEPREKILEYTRISPKKLEKLIKSRRR